MWVGGEVCAYVPVLIRFRGVMTKCKNTGKRTFFFFFPFMLVRHEVCVWFTSRQPCHTALKNSIWCERVFTLLLSDAQPWPSCPEYTQQLCDTLACQPNCLGDWVGISHSLVAGPDGVRWWWVCCVMGTNVVVWWLFLSGGRNTTEIQDNKRLNNTA